MKLISNFKELYYSDQLPTELHDWFVIEECDRAWNFNEDLEQHQIPTFLDYLQARYGISIGKLSNCPRGDFYERNQCEREIPALSYWKDTKKFHTFHKNNKREDILFLNKLNFFWWDSCETGFCIRHVNQNLPKSRKKEFVKKEIDELVSSIDRCRVKPIPFKNPLLTGSSNA